MLILTKQQSGNTILNTLTIYSYLYKINIEYINTGFDYIKPKLKNRHIKNEKNDSYRFM